MFTALGEYFSRHFRFRVQHLESLIYEHVRIELVYSDKSMILLGPKDGKRYMYGILDDYNTTLFCECNVNIVENSVFLAYSKHELHT